MSDSDLDLDDRELTKSPDKSIEALRSAAEPTKRKGNSEQDRAPEVSNADLFSLMTTYFNNKLSGIEKNFSDTTETLVKRAKKAENTFKFKGNQVQFELNSDIQDSISTAIGYIEKNRPKKAVRVLEDSSVQLKKRNKSEGGWRTVNEYLSDEVASDSEDEKRIRAADNRAVKKIKAEKTDKRSSRKRPAEASGSTAQMAHNGTGGSDATFRLQPFRGAWPPAAKVSATKIASRPQTSATTVACKGTGQETAGRERQGQDLPEDLLLKDHNSDIFKKYLGFSWKLGGVTKFFVFTVLPFGLKSSGYIFTKVVRPLVKHWRKKGIKVVVYLDDGFGLADNENTCKMHSDLIKSDLIASGFVPNRDKCHWTPTQKLEWLGFIWNLDICKLNIPDRKKYDLIDLVNIILNSSCKVKVRLLAKAAGKIISFTPALGHNTQIMSRGLFEVINLRQDWNQSININHCNACIRDLIFWRDNICKLEPVSLLGLDSEFYIFTDASNTGAAGYIDNLKQIMHKSWSDDEKLKSSTWREVKAIELSILSFARLLKHCTVSFYTDNQNAVTIVHKGSKVPELQSLALSIYDCCRKNDITIFVNWIPREQNEQADMLSRIVDIDDWRISDEFFTFLNDLWGHFQWIGLLAFENTKLQKFNLFIADDRFHVRLVR
ncbi:Hypothetical predicted protein [Mytilus galloprovincialis]|uniref:Reverse transcriptase domain-containing protein n=1 Tax=Mytilus galloprovincialis TaxID=29158 RepID=A0A8B6EXS7_MYTGA|nr:Hypothetical predicted protein [Mytilus galloprovincialis]